MAFDPLLYRTIIETAEDNQSTVEGRLARTLLSDPNWDFTASLSIQQSAIDTRVGNALTRFTRTHGKQYDSSTLKTVLGEWYGQAGGVVSSSPLMNGLVAYYKLDEGTGVTRVDSTGRGNDLNQFTGTPGNAGGVVQGNSIRTIRASIQDVHRASTPDLTMGSTDFTITCWVWFDSVASAGTGRTIFSKDNPTTEYILTQEFNAPASQKFAFAISTNGSSNNVVVVASMSAAVITRWYFVAVTFTLATKTITIQVDGGAVTSTVGPADVFVGSSSFYVGTIHGINDTWGHDGRVDELAIWKRKLTTDEIAYMWGGGAPPEYPFNHFQTLVFNDDFSGTALDTSLWTTPSPFIPGANGQGSANVNEKQAYVAEQVSVSGGSLQLTCDHAVPPIGGLNFKSGIVHTRFKYHFTYGRFLARMKIPAGQGFWPTFWLMPADGSWPPEIDIEEQSGALPNYARWGVNNPTFTIVEKFDFPFSFFADYHDFELLWNSATCIFKVDGIMYANIAGKSPTIPMYVILDLALGGGWIGEPDGTTPYPSSVLVDYVRVWSY